VILDLLQLDLPSVERANNSRWLIEHIFHVLMSAWSQQKYW